MRQLVHEEPIVPVQIDRENELQAYYSCIDDLVKEQPPVPAFTPSAPDQYPSPNQYQPTPWQGNPYPQGGYLSYPPQPTIGYPPTPAQPQYPGYAPNPAYPAYPQPSGYPQGPPNPYGAYPGYQGYAQPPPQMPPGGWPGYHQPYGGYAQPQQPSSYPPYAGYPPSNTQMSQEIVTEKRKGTEQSSSLGDEGMSSNYDDRQPHAPLSFGWNETLFSDVYAYKPAPYPTYRDSYYAGQNLVQETVSASQAPTSNVSDYYARQFERLHIGWNV